MIWSQLRLESIDYPQLSSRSRVELEVLEYVSAVLIMLINQESIKSLFPGVVLSDHGIGGLGLNCVAIRGNCSSSTIVTSNAFPFSLSRLVSESS